MSKFMEFAVPESYISTAHIDVDTVIAVKPDGRAYDQRTMTKLILSSGESITVLGTPEFIYREISSARSSKEEHKS